MEWSLVVDSLNKSIIKKRKDLLLLKFLVIFAGKMCGLPQKFPVEMIIPRQNYVDLLAAGRGNGLVKIVTGGRRCGKYFLLFNLFHRFLKEQGIQDDHIIELSLDDLRNSALRDPMKLLDYIDHHTANDGSVYYVILDEVQEVDRFVELKRPSRPWHQPWNVVRNRHRQHQRQHRIVVAHWSNVWSCLWNYLQ